MNKIAAVVVTYNRKELLVKCINSLLNQSLNELDIWIIDNASTDGTNELIEQKFGSYEQVKYMNTGANLGGAGGFSYGIKKTVLAGYEYLWIMDDDTIPTETALEKLWEKQTLLKNQFGFLASYVKWIDGSSCEMNVPSVSLKWREKIDDQFDHRMIRIDSASFVSLLIKTEAVRKVGLPIKEFFIWGDDLEYTKRISREYPCYFVYDSQVVHEMKSNSGTSILDEQSDRLGRYRYMYRNRYYVAKHGAKRDKILYWLLVKNTIKDLRRSCLPDKKKRIAIVLKSCKEGLFFNPQIEYIE